MVHTTKKQQKTGKQLEFVASMTMCKLDPHYAISILLVLNVEAKIND